jgi:hypothetical protein
MAYDLPAEGTRRLRHAFGIAAVAGCVLAYVVIVILHGAPYWKGWWVVMALALAASYVVARALARPIEWVIAGYKG